MTNLSSNRLKVFATDFAGVVLIAAAILFGWIPGPGGIPLLIAGLSLLSINHDWAKRWLRRARRGGVNIMGRIFVDHPVIKIVLDLVGLGLIILSITIMNSYTRNVARTLAISIGFLGVGLFLGNRQRMQRLINYFRRQK